MKYFAYGSNMFSFHFRDCARKAQVIGLGKLLGYQLRFHKRSMDGSAKCDAFKTGSQEDLVYGVIYEIELEQERRKLDRKEGLGCGYNKNDVDVETDEGASTVFTYLADSSAIDDTLKPYTWYKDFVVYGAKEHGLPEGYVEKIESVEADLDPDEERHGENHQVLLDGLEELNKKADPEQ
ncbi:MAG: gamma-glutamylcyclotransferase [Candidatus Omnitrophica bacterium]|nr:gamma-glutamylcyclotransferase [Candidatus Omnitrophota bacterium]